ncbi:MAG: hypothetical protein IT162_12865 [Bryobacterales bacterium]|nr:hypothetical protein [Bryobacterales bacterium]
MLAAVVAISCLHNGAWATSCVRPEVCARLPPESVFFTGELLPGDAEPVTLSNGGKVFRRRVRVVEALFGPEAQATEVPVLFLTDSAWSGT